MKIENFMYKNTIERIITPLFTLEKEQKIEHTKYIEVKVHIMIIYVKHVVVK